MPLVLTCLWLLAASASAETPADPAAMMQHLARAQVVTADFVQTRRLAGMDMAVEITGSMVFERGGRLRWQVDAPVRSVTVIERDKLTHFDGESGKLAVIRQETFPWMKVLRDSLDDWLAGDPKRFEGRFAVTSPAPHTLRLVPCEDTLKKLYRSVEIELAPDGASIAAVRLEENTGDRLEIRFLKVKNDPELPQTIWRMPPE